MVFFKLFPNFTRLKLKQKDKVLGRVPGHPQIASAMASESEFKVSAEFEKFLCDRLLDPDQSISERFRALFSLRNLRGPAPREALIRGCYSKNSL